MGTPAVRLSPEEWQKAQLCVIQLAQELLPAPERFSPVVHERTARALTIVGSHEEAPDAETLQKVRDDILSVRGLLGNGCRNPRVAKQLAGLCDEALELLSGEG